MKTTGQLMSNLRISISQVAESVSVTSSSTFIARQVKLDKKRAELEARHAFVKAEAEANKNILSKLEKQKSNLKSLQLN